METTEKKTLGKRLSSKMAERITVITDDAVERMERDKQATADIKPKKVTHNVWLRWEIDPKTKTRTLLGVHATLKSAQLSLPKEFQDLAARYPADSPYVLNYITKAIERRELED